MTPYNNSVYLRNCLFNKKLSNLSKGTDWIALYVHGDCLYNSLKCFDSFGVEHIPK